MGTLKSAFDALLERVVEKKIYRFVFFGKGVIEAKIDQRGISEKVGFAGKKIGTHHAIATDIINRSDLIRANEPELTKWQRFLGWQRWHKRILAENDLLREKLLQYHEQIVDLGRKALNGHINENIVSGIVAANQDAAELFVFRSQRDEMKKTISDLSRKLEGMTRAHDRLYRAWYDAHINNPHGTKKPPNKKLSGK